MITYQFIEPGDLKAGDALRDEIASFLYVHLDEFGDEKKDIARCIDYALDTRKGRGGFIVMALDGGKITGVVVVNQTGMGGYIPENILVYIASHRDYRGQGIGKELMEHAINRAEGDIALHVEPHNPAKFLYEKYGFTNKYLEMRFKNDERHGDKLSRLISDS